MSDAQDFSFQIKREFAEQVGDARELVALIALTAVRGVVMKSPVDTGRFKGNWNVGIAQPDETTTETVDPSGGSTITEADSRLQAYEAFQGFPVVHISNNLPYAARLEDGYSGQAPNGMVGLTVAELEAQFDGQDV